MLQFLDNFQQYGTDTGNMLDGVYAEVEGFTSLVTDPDPTASGTVLKQIAKVESTTPFWGSYVRRVLSSTQTTVGVARRIYLTKLPTTTNDLPQPIVLADSANAAQLSIKVTPTGTLAVMNGSVRTGTVVAESSICIVAQAWQHIEAKMVIHDTTGSVEIRVDGITVLNATNIDTKTTAIAGASSVIIANSYAVSNGNVIMYTKDLAIWDGSAGQVSNFVGSCFVHSCRPDGDTSGTWSIGGALGTKWDSINETDPDDDTTYIYSPWPAATAQVCTLSDLPADATVVKGAMSMVRSRKSDGGDGQLQVSIVSGTNTVDGADRAITPAYTYWTDVFETDPDTGAVWTVAAINAAKIKFNRTL